MIFKSNPLYPTGDTITFLRRPLTELLYESWMEKAICSLWKLTIISGLIKDGVMVPKKTKQWRGFSPQRFIRSQEDN